MRPLIIFTGGIILGSVLTYFATKQAVEKRCQNDINEILHRFEKSADQDKSEPEKKETDVEMPKHQESTIDDYADFVKARGYVNYSTDGVPKTLFEKMKEAADKEFEDLEEEDEEEIDYGSSFPVDDIPDPYEIRPEEFVGGSSYYDQQSLIFCTQTGDVITEDGQLIENVSELLGSDWKVRLQNSVDDAIYIRNEGLGTEYELYSDYANIYEPPGLLETEGDDSR